MADANPKELIVLHVFYDTLNQQSVFSLEAWHTKTASICLAGFASHNSLSEKLFGDDSVTD